MPSRKSAILAKCHNCMGEYADGLHDCENPKCPLYSWMPYRKKKPDLWWEKYSHKRIGLHEPKQLTDEQRIAAGQRLRKSKKERL
jgi:hypothetical protein